MADALLPSGKIYCSHALADLDARLSVCEAQAGSFPIGDQRIRGIHFFIGDPPLNPPTVRGSVLLRLHPQFLLDNYPYFIVGRAVDLDGVKFGHLPKLPCDLRAEDLELGRTKFIAVCRRLAMLAADELCRFSSQRRSVPALDVLKDVLPVSLVEYMKSTENFHARAFEYELHEAYILRPRHVLSLHVPKTYMHTPVARSLSRRLGEKLKPYNPKYGIEAMRASERAPGYGVEAVRK
ncbi:hypothetical protein ACMHYJ_03115 [Castellaniella hirudinis]|uniref:hypothetical protein n=1 Tax=Castellaniella hirudinis TaxID=1144617 RepID=UPI0039C4A14A